MWQRLTWAIMFVWWHSAAVHAEIVVPENAKIGLVLSGGGARGLAHVGVIRVLESQGIKPDIITGTSMGSIVGALYATGRSAEEIDRLARNMNWRDALSDASPRRHQPYPFRQLEAGMTADFRMSISPNGITFPRGVIEGQHLEQVLGELFEQQGRALTFEQLPIQFAAVAADLETGEQVVLDSGDVTSAIRASMSIPGALAPVQRDGRLLVDGGIANNMPVDLARQMGADFIVAVDVTAPLRKREELTSIFAIASQTSAFLVRLNTVAQRVNLRDDEVLILPDLDGYGAADFDQDEGIIEAGVEAALIMFDQDKSNLSVVEEATPDVEEIEPVIDFLEIKNDSVVGDDSIRSLVRQKVGEQLNRAELEDDLSRLYGLDYFSLVRYNITNADDQTGLEIICVARETGNSWLKMGLEMADDFSGHSDFGLSASLRQSGLNSLGGTAFGRLELGTDTEIELRFLQPLDTGLTYFVEPAVGYKAGVFDVYLDDLQEAPLSEYQKGSTWVEFSLGRTLWRELGEIRFGLSYASASLDLQAGLDLASLGVNTSDFHDSYYFVRVGIDSLDDLGFPSNGLRWSITHEEHDSQLGAESNFSRFNSDFTVAISAGRQTLLIEGDAEIGDNDSSDFIDIPSIGGFLELSGLPPDSRYGRHRVLLRSVLYRRLTKKGPLPVGLPVYVGASIEKGNVWIDRKAMSWGSAVTAASVFLAARTPLGPAYLSFGATDEGDRSVSIFLGQRFR
ncbi:patatin-like phospholipase family protein [Ketobacter sp.]|nr:MAG: hypothetical protein D6160_21250 [Ketobacter sp.]